MDRKPPASTDAPALDGDGLSLGAILGLEEAAPSGRTVHEVMADQFKAILSPAEPGALRTLHLDDPQALVASWVRDCAGLKLGAGATWVRFVRTDLRRGATFIIHGPRSENEAELIVLAERGVLSRGMIRDVCRWAFWGLGLWRVVVHIPADRADLADLARRAGFRFEGTARRYFGGALDAQTWAMCGPECKWLPQVAPAIPPDVSPPASLKVH